MILGIYGAGGLGRELLILARQINEIEHRWENLIFIDDTEGLTEKKGKQVISFEEAKLKYTSENLELVIAVGEPRSRRLLREKIDDAGFSLTVLVHPSVTITKWTNLGVGTIICYNCFVSCDVKVGENVLIQPGATIGHDSQIGNDTVISTFVSLSGGCTIGEETYIGLHVPVKENTIIGSQTIVGMGSVVIRDIPDQVIAIGNPARTMKENIDHKVFHI